MYSIVLGLEVLGNPVGFIKGLKDGTIGLFYQPIQVIVTHVVLVACLSVSLIHVSAWREMWGGGGGDGER